ncbi:MAG TPA: DEAD/DEAH box helicase [Methylomirabilota bacterium]|nr:DEAD/DEAH box helicase [Methylomirabilota bacterium]
MSILSDVIPNALADAYHQGRLQALDLDLYRSFQARYSFPFDDFQVQAIRAILEGDSVIVSAPTGAGKTLIAEFSIYRALRAKQRIAYTTPLKALSNQKYADFCRQFGVAEAGILTGDVKVNSTAPLLVMTTEILRNMFYTGGLSGLGFVVLDECHYMGDSARGTVWEEIIVNAPKDVRLVALSATVSNVEEIADWISLVHRPIVAITHPDRPVPLQYLVCDQSAQVYPIDALRHGALRGTGEPSDGRDRRRWRARWVADPTQVIEELAEREWLPAIYFIFSRAGCERAMDSLLADGTSLLTTQQSREVEQAIQEAVQETPGMNDSLLNQTILQALRRGAGLHHAGILPTIKRLTETLFERGLTKVVFATETMSLGIHMPARSVVLQSLTKRTDQGFRTLTHNELTQMAGRAGRRGIDPQGQCVIALDHRDSVESVLTVVEGPSEPIESQFRLSYGSVALLLSSGSSPEIIRRQVESSFGQYQNLKRICRVEDEARKLEASLAEARAYDAPCGDFSRIGRYRALRQEVAEHRRREGRERGRRRDPLDAEPGRLVLLRRRGGGTLGVVLASHPRKGRSVVDVLLPHGTPVRAKISHIKKIFWATPAIPLPHGLRQPGRDHLRDMARQSDYSRAVVEQMEKYSLNELLERERRDGPEGQIEAVECHRCPWNAQPRCDQAWKAVEQIETRLGQRREALRVIKNAYWEEFCRVQTVLERFGAARDAKLTSKGVLVASLRHDNELLVAEVVHRGILADTTSAEAACLCSCLSEESRSGDSSAVKRFLKTRAKLKRKLQQIESVAQTVFEAQREHHLSLPVSVNPGFLPAVYRWASGDDDWTSIVEESFGGHEGDLIRAFRRVIDVLRQLSDSSEVPQALASLLGETARRLDRGIVFESALII